MRDNDQSRFGTTPEGKTRTFTDGRPNISSKNGIVIGCKSLLIREKPDKNAGIVTVISAGSEVTINKEHSTDQFYKVRNNAGIEGFCMRRYIRIRP